MQRRMVVRLADGERLKGYSHDFVPGRRRFHLQVMTREGKIESSRAVSIDEVHAVFFVRDFAFDRRQRYTADDAPRIPTDPPPSGGRRLRVRCVWGETLEGLSYDYDPDDPGVFVFPTNPPERTYNLNRAYLTKDAIERVETPSAA